MSHAPDFHPFITTGESCGFLADFHLLQVLEGQLQVCLFLSSTISPEPFNASDGRKRLSCMRAIVNLSVLAFSSVVIQ